MKRNAFTMIELIFVIVILGILAAIAIPKLTATRDDAKISQMASNVSTVISDISSAYTSQGILTTWGDSTNAKLMLSVGNTASNSAVTVPAYLYNGDKQCFKFVSTVDGNLTVSKGSNITDVVCKNVQLMQDELLKSHVFGGLTVVY